MSLNPSNAIAQSMHPKTKVLPNLARRVTNDPEQRQVLFDGIDAACRAELEQAGITAEGLEMFRSAGNGCFREVPTMIVGSLCQWGFRRSWYYWTAEGPGIPPELAQAFHETWGTHCRVEGHCGCPSPLEQCKGFAVGSYHIDTQEGLNAFADLLRSIHRS